MEPLKRDSHRFLLKNIIHWFFSLSGNVEDWLLEVERVMRDSLRKILGDSLEVYPTVRAFLYGIILFNQSPKGNMWSAIPVALLCMLVIVGDGWQGSDPKGDNVLCNTGGLLLNRVC